MPLFKPNQSVMAQPMATTAPQQRKQSYGLMSTPERSFALAEQGKPPVTYASQPKVQDVFGFLQNPQQFTGTEADYENIRRYAQFGEKLSEPSSAALASAGGLMSPTPAKPVSYSMVSNQFDTPVERAQKAAAVPPEMRPQTMQDVVSASYRAPMLSRLEGMRNPFGEDYQRALEARAISAAEQQYSQAADQIRSQLASRGLMAGGGTGLEAGLLARARMQAAGERTSGVKGAMQTAAERSADFEARRAQAIDQYNMQLQQEARALSMLPSQVRRAETEATMSEVEAAIKNFTPQQIEAMRNASIEQAVNQGIMSRQEAEIKKNEARAADILTQKQISQWDPRLKEGLRNVLMGGGALLGGALGFAGGGAAGTVALPVVGTAGGAYLGAAGGAATGGATGRGIADILLTLFGQ